MAPVSHSFFATTAKGMEALLAAELRQLGGTKVVEQRAGVAFCGPLEVAYRACLWSRVANRVLLPLASFQAETPAALYDGVRNVRWWEQLSPQQTLAVDFAATESAVCHSHYGALKTKDAIVDQLRERTGTRPSVSTVRPDIRVNVYLHRNRAVVSLDLSGDSLHRRGYRQQQAGAPLKENLAAAVLLLADWPRLASTGAALIDPMCGSGTLPIEAALMAAGVAPGSERSYFGFLKWHGHQPQLWDRLRQEAAAGAIRDPKRLPRICGYDEDPRAVRAAIGNVERVGMRGCVHIEKRALSECEPIAARGASSGLVVTNPPYGVRLGERAALAHLYATLGDTLRRKFVGWTGYVLTGDRELGQRIGLRAARRHILFNGAIECRLLAFPISPNPVRDEGGPRWRREHLGQDGARSSSHSQRRETAQRTEG
ncbi:MAG: hypothetical protein HY699_11060 [Deltaproteobacteria bacterium]|nr:hypothetical protein [Deltaproteobacteria bacterium]